MATITASGIGSGLDVNGLVTQLVAAERQGADSRLERKERIANAQLTAFSAMKGALASFQSSLATLSSASTYQKYKTSVSNEDIASLTASTGADVGNFDLEVSQLAKAHSLASGSFSSTTEEVGLGTLTFRFGTTDYNAGTDTYNSFNVNAEQPTGSVVIDSTNNTLEGIRDSVNGADIGVRASIVNDGSGYRLLFTSEETGAANSLEIAVSDGDGVDTDASGLSQLAFNASATHMAQTVAGQDALLSINGLSISSASNTVDQALEGVSLELKGTTSGAPVSMSIARDEASVRASIVGMIEGYNKFIDVINQYGTFDEELGYGGILQGDATQRSITSQLRQLITGAVENVSDEFSTLAELGITTLEDGKLEFDNSRLVEVVRDHFDDIAGMFAAVGKPSDSLINFYGSDKNTVVGQYSVEITQLATRGTINGASVLPDFSGGGSIVVDATNDNFVIRVDGLQSEEITLTHGTYTSGDELAAEIQSRINGDSEFTQKGVSVAVTYDSVNNRFDIVSDQYGSESRLEIVSADAALTTAMGFAIGSGTDGVDVAGTINGQAATGTGQILTGAEGSDTEGMQLEVLGGAIGARGNVLFTRGIADQLNTLIGKILEDDGVLDSRTDSINNRLEGITDDRARLDRRMEMVEARYRRQFTQLDLLLSQATSMQNFLSQQLAALPGAYSGGDDN